MGNGEQEFSFRTRQEAISRLKSETFDLLIIGGGITGVAVARDAASRGLKVAVVEKHDFATGTSSRSSKLIHGGLRYLENFEFGLVFEALAERALLLKTAPHMVRPLPFYFPVYRGDANGKFLLGLGMWLYDLLALFRTPYFHKSYSKKGMLKEIPFLKQEGLKGGFRYSDASMWDDVLVVETARAAAKLGAAIATYVQAEAPIRDGESIKGFRVRDLESGQGEFDVRASRVVVCAGPWTDELGAKLSPSWRPWLKPSKGVHLIFDLKRIPVPGAMVMSHPEDGRIAFVIPRPDFGPGVVIVGTTDGPTPKDPEKAAIDPEDVSYLLGLLNRYFPSLGLKDSDILSAYVGVRPLFGDIPAQAREGGIQSPDLGARADDPASNPVALQKVSREHTIGDGPGGTVVVAGGKYTTHRKMAEEIVDYALKSWSADAKAGRAPRVPPLHSPRTREPVNPLATREAMEAALGNGSIPSEAAVLVGRYGAEARSVLELSKGASGGMEDPAGFPLLEAQLRFCIRHEMVLHLEDFVLRRIPLFACRADQGLPWVERLARIWAEERGLSSDEARTEIARLRMELERRNAWRKRLE